MHPVVSHSGARIRLSFFTESKLEFAATFQAALCRPVAQSGQPSANYRPTPVSRLQINSRDATITTASCEGASISFPSPANVVSHLESAAMDSWP